MRLTFTGGPLDGETLVLPNDYVQRDALFFPMHEYVKWGGVVAADTVPRTPVARYELVGEREAVYMGRELR